MTLLTSDLFIWFAIVGAAIDAKEKADLSIRLVNLVS